MLPERLVLFMRIMMACAIVAFLTTGCDRPASSTIPSPGQPSPAERANEAAPTAEIETVKSDAAAQPTASTSTAVNAPVAIPAHLLEGSASQRRSLQPLLQLEAPPTIEATEWLNSEPLVISELKGKVVMLDFWGTWCPPCLRAIPKMNELHAKYADQGLVIIGVCHSRNVERMGDVVRERGITYPVCADRNYTTSSAYFVNGYPDYFFIDRSGRLRIADVANHMIEEAITLLLAEPAP